MVDAREYHERTKHSPRSLRESDFSLDPETKPRPYKRYASRPRYVPEDQLDPPDTPALAAIAQGRPDPTVASPDTSRGPDPRILCYYATGVTKELERRGQTRRFRAAACTGKLYHIDLYVVTGDGSGFDAGIYHYDPEQDAFDVLRRGDYRGVLAHATGGYQAVAEAPVTIVATSEWWRNAWKYRARTYRHAFWDAGTILANLLATAHGGGHRAEIVPGFVDEIVADLIGVDPHEEAPLTAVSVGSGAPAPDPPAVPSLEPETVPPTDPDGITEYPLIPDAWRQSRLRNEESVRSWREQLAATTPEEIGCRSPGTGEQVSLQPVDSKTASARPVGATIERRGSLREYAHSGVSSRKFATVLDRAIRGVPMPGRKEEGPKRVTDTYVLVHAVDGIPSGAYQYHPGATVLERVGDTNRETAGHIALDQSVVGDAAVNVHFLADVDAIVEQLGNRGYRLAQLEAGITLGRLYLATYAHRVLGGRGFTFYDDEVTEHFAPQARHQTPMCLFAFGHSAK